MCGAALVKSSTLCFAYITYQPKGFRPNVPVSYFARQSGAGFERLHSAGIRTLLTSWAFPGVVRSFARDNSVAWFNLWKIWLQFVIGKFSIVEILRGSKLSQTGDLPASSLLTISHFSSKKRSFLLQRSDDEIPNEVLFRAESRLLR